jgi:hypothetical protein
MRFPDPRVQALLAACCALALRPRRLHQPRPAAPPRPPAGKRSRGHVRGQISYDLRRLRAHQIIERIPQPHLPAHRRGPVHGPVLHPADQARHHPRTRRHRRCRPAARQRAPPGRPRLQHSHRRPRQPGLIRHPATTRHQAPLTSCTSRNTQPKLTRLVKSLRERNLCANLYVANGCDDRKFSLAVRIGNVPSDRRQKHQASLSLRRVGRSVKTGRCTRPFRPWTNRYPFRLLWTPVVRWCATKPRVASDLFCARCR